MQKARLVFCFSALIFASHLSLGAPSRNLPLDRLSSGALLRLDNNGDLVELPSKRATRLNLESAASSEKESAAAIALDPRVGANIRLGDDPGALPGNQRAQAEPHIARAPSDADFLLATFQEGRFTNGGALDCGYSVSHNGGLSWTRALIPDLSRASGGTYDRATDPVAGIDRNGTAYLNTLGLNSSVDIGVVLVSRSTDGGNTFAAPTIAYQAPNTNVFPDKNWMAINTFANTPTAGRVVATFTLFYNTGSASPIMRVFSDNGGQTWSNAAPIHATNKETQGSQPVFLPDGRLAIIYWNFASGGPSGDDFLELVISNDGGVTFGAPKFITNSPVYAPPAVRSGSFLPSAATDRTTSNLYVVYQTMFQGSPRVMFTKSTNAGDSWSAPIPISDNPSGSNLFNPAISASPDGQTLTAAFYDQRDNLNAVTRYDMYLAQSFDGGATWQPNIRFTSTSTDAELAPNTGTALAPAYMLGDYLGIAGTTEPNVPAVPVWIDTRTENPDPFVARIGIAPSFNFTSWQAARLSLGQINDPALGGEAGDADGDGEGNLSEFRKGTDPNDGRSVFHTSRQVNISTRARVEDGEKVLIAGFIITGSNPKRVIARALGPSLAARGLSGGLDDPTLELVPENGPHTFNDNWQDSDAAAIQATGIPPDDSRESAIVQTLLPGRYTAILRSRTNTPGIGLVELYDLSPDANSRFANLSSRGLVAPGENNVIIGGVIVGDGEGANGAGSVRVALRGIGPSLAQRDVSGALQDPELVLLDANANIIATNDDWKQSQEQEVRDLNLAPDDERESVIVTTLRRGNYTAIVRGKGETTGIALVESYNVD